MQTILRPTLQRSSAPWLLLGAAALCCWAWAGRSSVPAAPPRPVAGSLAPGGLENPVRLAVFQGEGTTVKEAFGAVTMAWVIETHFAIDILADAIAKEVYELEDGESVLGYFESLVGINQLSFRSLAKSDELDAAEKRLMRDLNKVCGLFLKQCEALRGIWDGEEAAVDEYNNLRREAADLIDEIYEIDGSGV